jgi:hypothetical protein
MNASEQFKDSAYFTYCKNCELMYSFDPLPRPEFDADFENATDSIEVIEMIRLYNLSFGRK